MSHHVDQCKHGYVYGQCRCISRDKEVRIVPCPNDKRHEDPQYEPKHSARSSVRRSS